MHAHAPTHRHTHTYLPNTHTSILLTQCMHTHTHRDTRTRLLTHACTGAHTRVCTKHTHTQTQAHTCSHMHTHAYTYMHLHTCGYLQTWDTCRHSKHSIHSHIRGIWRSQTGHLSLHLEPLEEKRQSHGIQEEMTATTTDTKKQNRKAMSLNHQWNNTLLAELTRI